MTEQNKFGQADAMIGTSLPRDRCLTDPEGRTLQEVAASNIGIKHDDPIRSKGSDRTSVILVFREMSREDLQRLRKEIDELRKGALPEETKVFAQTSPNNSLFHESWEQKLIGIGMKVVKKL